MRVGILGSGMVGQALAKGFLASGDDVMVGTRDKAKLNAFSKDTGAMVGSFEDTAVFGEILVVCCKGTAVGSVVALAGEKNFDGKVVIDTTNPLEARGENEPPEFSVAYPDSLGKKLQEMLPDARIVKAFNIVTNAYMHKPKLKEGTPDMFIAGNDKQAKKRVTRLLNDWGWPVHDLGDISQSYLLEAMAMIWIRYGYLNNNWTHAFKLLKE